MLTEEEKREIIALVLKNRPLPEEYRTRLFSASGCGVSANASLKACLLERHLPARADPNCLNKPTWINSIFWGDNKEVLSYLLSPEMSRELEQSGGIKLIYIDPPFNAARNFRLNCPKNFPAHPPFAYEDFWEDGLAGYLDWLSPRLLLMRELLARDGLIFVHCDWRLSARLRLILDDIFNYHVNEIIWHYTGGGRSARFFSRKHDSIFIYAKSPGFNFYPDQIRIPYSPTSSYAKNGICSRAGKKYMPNPLGAVPDDVWDIPIINPLSAERNAYPTQKPEALLERIILSCTRPGDLVADFFCGSGVTGAVAQKLGRKWLLADIGFSAVQLCKKRLRKLPTSENGSAPASFSLWTVKAESATSGIPFPRLPSPLRKAGDILLSEGEDELWLLFPGPAACRWEKIINVLKGLHKSYKNIFVLASAYVRDCLDSGKSSAIWAQSRFHLLNLPPCLNSRLPLRLQCGPALFPGFKPHHDGERLALEIAELQWGADIRQYGLVRRHDPARTRNKARQESDIGAAFPSWEHLLDYWAVDLNCGSPGREEGMNTAPPFEAFCSCEKSGEDGCTPLLSPFMPCKEISRIAVKVADIFFNESLIFLEDQLAQGCCSAQL